MLSQSDFPIDDALAFFAKAGVEAAFFVPTATALNKSIIDAHESLLAFLKRQEIHDFGTQLKGASGKVTKPVHLIGASGQVETELSLYRPETKSGDPRFWVYKLANHAEPRNLFALFLGTDGVLVVANVSDPAVWASRDDPSSSLARLLGSGRIGSAERELLDLIEPIAAAGYVPSMRSGDTGIGYTLETLLGIAANSSKAPDYKGIELKASRKAIGNSRTNRVNLFSQVPDWKSSTVGNAADLIAGYGYVDANGRHALYCTTSNVPNPQTLYFDVGDDAVVRCMSVKPPPHEVVRWYLATLETRLKEKHASTFWVKADVALGLDGTEHFHYREIVHSRQPILANLGPLIHTGKVTMDFTMHIRPDGKPRDHGYLFKIDPGNLDLLFPPPLKFTLADAVAFEP